jgi:DNA-binding LytR/AlgR family response regulator
LIVDDEPLARSVLEGYISFLPNLELVASCKNSGEAIAALQECKVDLIFCDIKMPGLNGLQFLKSLHQPPKMIITTAYREYAVDGFDLGVADYLLKPIPLERFLLAVNRALDIESKGSGTDRKTQHEFMFFKIGTSSERVFLESIDHITAYGNYCKIHVSDSNRYLAVNHKISELENMLRSKEFVRVHKSYIVNRLRISKLTSTSVYVNSLAIPVGESYKKKLIENITGK